MFNFNLIFKLVPWLFLLVLTIAFYITFQSEDDAPVTIEVTNTAVLERIEALGKMELVKYNFKEITQLDESLAEFAGFRLFNSSIVLISKGEAVGCVDLAKITAKDVLAEKDTLYVTLPSPELCYYKLDMDETQIFSLSTATFSDDKAFIQKAYTVAEREIKKAAHNSGILEQTETNARLTLRPILETLTDKVVMIDFSRTQDTLLLAPPR